MGILMKIFTWWDGATIGTHLWASRAKGEHVGTDFAGNKYYRSKGKAGANTGSYTQREKRWVIYNGANDASRVPAEWHGWLHNSYDAIPESHLPPPRIVVVGAVHISQALAPMAAWCPTRSMATSSTMPPFKAYKPKGKSRFATN